MAGAFRDRSAKPVLTNNQSNEVSRITPMVAPGELRTSDCLKPSSSQPNSVSSMSLLCFQPSSGHHKAIPTYSMSKESTSEIKSSPITFHIIPQALPMKVFGSWGCCCWTFCSAISNHHHPCQHGLQCRHHHSRSGHQYFRNQYRL